MTYTPNEDMKDCYLLDLADKEAAPTIYNYNEMNLIGYPFKDSQEGKQNRYLVYEVEETPHSLNIDFKRLRQWLDDKHKQSIDVDMQSEGAPIVTHFGELRNIMMTN